MSDFCMPSLGADMEVGILSSWNVKPGDKITKGETIAEIETDKGLIEIEVFENGIIGEILVQEGEKVPVGTVLAKINSNESSTTTTTPTTLATNPPQGEFSSKVNNATIISERKKEIIPQSRVRISPLAKKIAYELGVELSQVQGTGPGGAIKRIDIEKAAATKTKGTFPTTTKKSESLSNANKGMRRAIAAAMARSNQEIPHYYLETQIDMSSALAWLAQENQKRTIQKRILPVVLLVKAVAKALSEVPQLNGYWLNGQHQPQNSINIGFAISLRQGGLVAPALHHADLQSFDELMEAIRDLILRTRAGKLRSSEMTDATATLTNLGDLGADKVFGVIYPPQIALVGFGKIAERPWVENGMIGIRNTVNATIAADHRATDGQQGAKFLEALNHYLQEVEKL